ncbi:SLC13 family permease [Paenibacillus methanolicus]|uniref:Sodium-dependent dicarboxylate transporter SdcS n=1 Tax=Paenibacillus methanolicus TaxID=582686 RepID=A0A5S5C8D7_9BACL|nr:SLC13 family permease [Paenibacillus methanolicus]TYP75449.1 di/tricarboxylate transporter [Paenibacillus methanolicus]
MKVSDIALFQGLSNVELSKLLGRLAKRRLHAGEALFEQGDFGESMFIIEHGEAQLYSQVGETRQPLAVLGPGDSLGEMALLTGETRSATVVAIGEMMLYEIDRETFDRLIAEHPSISAYFIRMLSRRLTATNGQLHDTLQTKSEWVLQELSELSEPLDRIVLWLSELPAAPQALIDHTFHCRMDEEYARHPAFAKLAFHEADEPSGGEGRYRIHPAFKKELSDRSAQRFGDDRKRAWREDAARFYRQRQRWPELAELYADAGDWLAALEAAEQAESSQDPADDGRPLLFEALRGAPAALMGEYPAVLERWLAASKALDPGAGLRKLEDVTACWIDQGDTERLPRLYERGADLCRQLGDDERAMTYLRLAEAADPYNRTSARGYELTRQELAGRRSREKAERARRLAGGPWAGWVSAIAAALCVLLFVYLPPVGDLSRHGMIFIGIGIAAVLLWIVNIVPDYIVALGMVLLWVLGGLIEPEQALSGFASPTWLYMIFIMALSAAITRSGILYRFSLHALKRFPPHYRGQLWGIVAGGIVLNPLIPSSSAKVSLGVPIARTLSESMGFRDRSGGAAGLGLTAMIFYGFTAPFLLTGSYTNAMAYGLVPDAPGVSWLSWALYALPGFAVFAAVMLGALGFMFRGTTAARPIEAGVLDEQLRLLGPLTKAERVSLMTVVGCIVLMMLQPLHGIDGTWILMGGFAVLVLSGTLDRNAVLTGIDWPFLLFLGVAFSFANAAEALGISAALSDYLGAHMEAFIASPTLFLCAVIALSFLVTLVVRDDPAVILLVTALIPLAEKAGVDPWIAVFIILLSTDPFFFAYQSPTYLTAYYSSEEKAFSHRQGQLVALFYAAAVVLVAVLSVPYWRWLGLIQGS